MVSAIILAAGFGTRMKSNIPKVLHKICGKSMIEYVIQEALKVSSDIHIVLYEQKEVIQDYLKSIYESYILDKITFHIQPYDKYAGTGGALMSSCKEFIDVSGDKILVINGDTPLITHKELEKLINTDSPVSIATFKTKKPDGYGRILQDINIDGKLVIKGIIEDKDCSPIEKEICEVNGGMYCFSKDILKQYIPLLKNNNAQKEYYITDIINLVTKDYLYSDNSISILSCKEKILNGINTKYDLSKVQDIVLHSLREKAMLQGVIMDIPESIYIDHDVEFEGECRLENGVRITGKSLIKESTIKAYTVIEESQIISSNIGTHAHIRPHCYILQSYIGNFVECKNAYLNGIKAGHLSYLGDCEIQEGSNIGAGVITCNYNGKEKHKTIIGKNVFIGSDCPLIAPIHIEDNVLVAAGSVVTKDIPSGSLTISRTKQLNIQDGYFRFFNPKN